MILILLIHENLGHKKKGINNEKTLTPRNHNDSNFKSFSLKEADSGDAVEYLLIGEFFDIELLMKNNDTEKLLNSNLYVSNTFEELRKIYNSIKNDIKKEEKLEIEVINKNTEFESNEDEEEEEEEEKEEREEETIEEEEEEEDNIYKKSQNQNIIKFNEEKEIYDAKGYSLNEKINKIIDEEQGEDNKTISNLFQKKKRYDKNNNYNNVSSPPEQKRLLFRQMKMIYGKMTKEERKELELKNDDNYKRYLEIIKNRKKKY